MYHTASSCCEIGLLPIHLKIGYNRGTTLEYSTRNEEATILEIRGIMGGFYRISEWIMRLSVINLLWVIFSIPFFGLLAMTFLTPYENADIALQTVRNMMPILAVIAPFTLVPASAAMFAVARKWVMGEEDVPLFKTFIRGYKDNYLQAMLGGLVFTVVSIILYVNYHFYVGMSESLRWLSMLFLSFGVVLVAAFINFLSILVHFQMKLFQILKNALILTLGQPFTSISLLAVNGIILYISTKFTFLIPFFMGSLCATASFWYFNRSIQKIQTKAEAYKEKQLAAEEGELSGETDISGEGGQHKQ